MSLKRDAVASLASCFYAEHVTRDTDTLTKKFLTRKVPDCM